MDETKENEKPKEKEQPILKKVEAEEDDIDYKYVAVRFIQLISIGAFIFGTLWEGTIRFNFSTPQFLMVYGITGAVISEALARLFKHMEKKKNVKEK